MSIKQFSLKFQHKNSYLEEDFFVSDSNRIAKNLIDLWPIWPQPIVAIYGPEGSGKTHLAQIWGQKSQSYFFTYSKTNLEQWLQLSKSFKTFVFDDQEEVRKNDKQNFEKFFFHLLNLIKKKKKNLLICSQMPPSRWSVDLPDLQSRLETIQAVPIYPPDDFLITALLVKKFSDYQLTINKRIIDYILTHTERSFVAIHHIVQQIDEYNLASKKPLNLSLVRQIIKNLNSHKKDL
ncbi:MAG: hypothetical protein K1X44_00285 [Alphaproteobacteria bacterium]|nr:hypothetical protein [Alphaproteobacteria bacterium]